MLFGVSCAISWRGSFKDVWNVQLHSVPEMKVNRFFFAYLAWKFMLLISDLFLLTIAFFAWSRLYFFNWASQHLLHKYVIFPIYKSSSDEKTAGKRNPAGIHLQKGFHYMDDNKDYQYWDMFIISFLCHFLFPSCVATLNFKRITKSSEKKRQ